MSVCSSLSSRQAAEILKFNQCIHKVKVANW